MQTCAEIRREKLVVLLEKFGTLAKLNEALGWTRTDPKLSQIKNNNKRPGRGESTYQMGDAMAREIEDKLGLERGWMDNPPSYQELLGENDPRIKVMQLMEGMHPEQWATAARLLDALTQPTTAKNGTTD
ncbi:MAG: hypothetical protein K2Q11_00365 [Burkholderiaceae bacterium]|nr:hypothetical protein [Burkholderiaceae bacterium]